MEFDNKDLRELTAPTVAYALDQIMSLTDNIEERCDLLQDLGSLLQDRPSGPIRAKKHSARLKQIAKEMQNQVDIIAASSTKQFHRGARVARQEISHQMRAFIQTELAISRAQATSDKWKKLRPLIQPKVAVAVGVGLSAVLLAAKYLRAGEDPDKALGEGMRLDKKAKEAAALTEAAKKALEKAEELKKETEKRLERYQKQFPNLGS